MKSFLDHIKSDWNVWSCEPEIKFLEAYTEEGRKLTLFYTGNLLETSYKIHTIHTNFVFQLLTIVQLCPICRSHFCQ